MNLTLRQLRYFVEIARSGSLSRAASHLNVAQPALSQNLAALEGDLGARLFERHARGVALSPAGERLYERALILLAGIDGLKDEVAGRDAAPAGAVRVSLAGSLSTVLVAPLLQQVAARFPAITLTVLEGVSSESRLQVESGQAQLALMPNPSELQGMAALPLLEERFVLIGAPAQLSGTPGAWPLAEVLQRPLAQPDRAHDLRKVIEREAATAGLAPDVRYELNSPAMLIAVVKAGLALALVPATICEEALAAGSIVSRDVVAPALTRVQALVWREDRPLAPAAAAVRDTLVDVMAALLADGRLTGRWLGPEPSHRIR